MVAGRAAVISVVLWTVIIHANLIYLLSYDVDGAWTSVLTSSSMSYNSDVSNSTGTNNNNVTMGSCAAPFPNKKILTREEIVQLMSVLESNMDPLPPSSKSKRHSESLAEINSLKSEHDTLIRSLLQEREKLHSTWTAFQDDEHSQAILRDHVQPDIVEKKYTQSQLLADMPNLLSILTLAPFEGNEDNKDLFTNVYEQAYLEIQQLSTDPLFLKHDLHSLFKSSGITIKSPKPDDNHDPLCRPPPLAITPISDEKEADTTNTTQEELATQAELLSIGKNIEDALLQRTDQYKNGKKGSSPLTPQGTQHIRAIVEKAASEAKQHQIQFEEKAQQLREERKQRQLELQKSQSTCVLLIDVQTFMRDVLEKEFRIGTSPRSTPNHPNNSNNQATISLSHFVETPIFYKTMQFVDVFVEYISGHNDLVDQLLDYLMIAIGNDNDDGRVGDYLQIHISNALDALEKVSSKIAFPSDIVERGIKTYEKTGILRGELSKVMSKTLQKVMETDTAKLTETGEQLYQQAQMLWQDMSGIY